MTATGYIEGVHYFVQKTFIGDFSENKHSSWRPRYGSCPPPSSSPPRRASTPLAIGAQPNVPAAKPRPCRGRSPNPRADKKELTHGNCLASGREQDPLEAQTGNKEIWKHQEMHAPAQEVQGHGINQVCPATGWQYVDKKGRTQGPFSLTEMRQWHEMGYFALDLLLRCDPNDVFSKLADLFPHPMIPFQSYPHSWRP
jgi:hypothetical protein